MKKDMPLEGLRWSRDSGSALYDTPQNGRSRTGWGALLNIVLLIAIIALYIEHRVLSMTGHFSGGFMMSTFFATPVFFLYCLKYRTYGKGSFIETLGKNHSGNIYYWQFVPYFLFVRYIVTEFNLENVCLLIMIFTLIGWSYCVNYIEKQILRRK